jgi:hypothetical protein
MRVDPVTIGAVLAAVAGGAGGALGAQVWAGVSALVRRPFRHHQAAGDAAAMLADGGAELVALGQVPAGDRQALAIALAEVLVARAGADPGFRVALQGWWEQAGQIPAAGSVINTVSGGALYGPVLQGRDFTGLTFGTPAAPPVPPPQDPGTR